MFTYLMDAVGIVVGFLLAVLLLYLVARLISKAWYRSKHEEETAVRQGFKNHLTKKGGNDYGKG